MRAWILVLIVAFAGCAEAPQNDADAGADGADAGGVSGGSDAGDASAGDAGSDASGSQTGSSDAGPADEGTADASSAVGTGSASIYIQDAATDEFDEIHVVVTKVEVHRAGDADMNESQEGEEEEGLGQDPGTGNGTGNETGNQTSGGNETGNGTGNETGNHTSGNDTAGGTGNETAGASGCTAGWFTIRESNGTDVDLMAATGDLAFFLGEADLAACKYTQIRIHVFEAYGIQDGNRTNITLANSILKIVHPFHVEDGGETQVIVDVDLDRSVKEVGGNGPNHGWRMTPVIGKVWDQPAADAESGADTHEEGEIAQV